MKDLQNKIDDLVKDFNYWHELSIKLEEKQKDIARLEEELKNREMIVEKETAIARERKIVLDAREKNIENQEARLQRLAQV